MGVHFLRRGFTVLALSLLPLAPRALAGDEPEDRLFPKDGLDVVVLEDDRVLRCRVSEEGKDAFTLEFPSGKVTVPRKGIEVRWWRDFDPKPVNAGETALVDKGMVRFGGQWVSAAFAAERRAKEVERVRRERAEDAAHAAWANRWTVPTAHFKIESNLPRRRIEEYARLLEEFVKTVKDGLSLAIPKSPLPVLVFRNRGEFEEFAKRETGGLTEHVVGYYQPPSRGGSREYLALFDFQEDPEETLDTLLHEATHWIVGHGSSDDVPIWLNEGLAEYYGGSTYRYRKFLAGGIQDDRLLWFLELVEQGKVIPLDTLVDLERGERLGEDFGLDHYAESWLFVHFLLHARQGAYRGAFRDSVRGVVRDCKAQLLHRMERKDFTKITEEMVAYAKGLGEKLPLGPAYAERGLRRLDEGNEKGAEADFRRALGAKEKDPRAIHAVALAFLRMEGRRQEAAGLLRMVVDADPLDARVRARLAEALPAGEGIVEARLAAALAPDDPSILGAVARALVKECLGTALRVKGEPQTATATEALAMAVRAAEVGGDADDVVTATVLSFALGKFADAAKQAAGGLRSDPDEAYLLGLLAAAKAFEGTPEEFALVLGEARTRWSAPAARPNLRRPPPKGEDGEEAARVARVGLERWAVASMTFCRCCFTWKKPAVAADALVRVYAAKPPATEDEWLIYVGVLSAAGKFAPAEEALKLAKALYPDFKAFEIPARQLILPGITDLGDEEKKDAGKGKGGKR